MSTPAPIAIFTIGTQGDIRPCVALGQGLKRIGYPVRIVTSSNFAGLVQEAGLEFYPLTADFQALLENNRQLTDLGLNLRAMARIFRDRFTEWAGHWVEEGSKEISDVTTFGANSVNRMQEHADIRYGAGSKGQ